MPLNRKEKFIVIRSLLETEGIGARKLLAIYSFFNSFEKILAADPKDFYLINGINKIAVEKLRRTIDSINFTSNKFIIELEKLNELNADFIDFWDDGYPEPLKNIYFPPILLYFSGAYRKEDENSIAVVGTRTPSSYGKAMAQRLTSQLCENKLTIVNGLARGIDSIAHQTAINKGGRTIAVIGSGLDVVYPPENKNLFLDITEQGVVFTEYPLGAKPDAQNFPRRNRIISGLSLGVLLIETRIKGGAMHTAAYALDQNKEVFALPGNITSPQSEGCNLLIKKGEAKLVQDATDIIEEFNFKLSPAPAKLKHIPEMNLFEQKIFDCLEFNPVHIDKISEITGLNTSECLVNLLSLEFKGLVKQYPGKYFSKL